MDWGNITERNYQFENEYQFSSDVDYIKEIDEIKRINESRDVEGRKAFVRKHNGLIAFWAKVAYFKEIKDAGLI